MFETYLKSIMFGSLVFIVGVSCKEVCKSLHCTRSAEMFLKNMDPNISPCHNFYDFMCGNFKKWNPIEPGKAKISTFTARERYVNEKILEFLNASDFTNFSTVQKTRAAFKTCMDEEKLEQVGEAVIPIELNTVGLPIRPPFNAALNRSYDFSRLMAKVHRNSVFTKFLFSVSMAPDLSDISKNYVHFDYTPSTYQFRSDEDAKELEVFAFRSHLTEDEKIEKKTEARAVLRKTMKETVHYMNKLTNAPSSEKIDQYIENRIEETVNFLSKINETKSLENPAVEGKFGKPTKITVAELQKKTDEILGGDNVQIKINWLDYFETLFEGIRENARQLFEKGEPIMIKNVKQLEATLKVVSEVSRQVFICALWWSVTQSVSSMGSAEPRKIYYDNYARLTKAELKPRLNRCLSVIKSQFPLVFAFVLVMADDESLNDRKKIHKMITFICDAFKETITESTWLDTSTKMAALNKLHLVTKIVSFQAWMLHPFGLQFIYRDRVVVPGHHYFTSKLQKKTSREKNLVYLGRVIKYAIKVPTGYPADVNAGYAADFNTIDIPIGILGPPVFGLGLEALNFGSIGTIIAHELGHAFDNIGKGYDSWGRRRQWWKKRTDREFHKRAECFVKSYSEIMIPSLNKKVNGRFTLGENIADFVGFKEALKAYRKYVKIHGEEDLLPHFEHYSHDKLFTMIFANTYCETVAPLYANYQLLYDEHSPGRARILGVLQNSPEFAEIWGCDEDAEMNPKEKCQLW